MAKVLLLQFDCSMWSEMKSCFYKGRIPIKGSNFHKMLILVYSKHKVTALCYKIVQKMSSNQILSNLQAKLRLNKLTAINYQAKLFLTRDGTKNLNLIFKILILSSCIEAPRADLVLTVPLTSQLNLLAHLMPTNKQTKRWQRAIKSQCLMKKSGNVQLL